MCPKSRMEFFVLTAAFPFVWPAETLAQLAVEVIPLQQGWNAVWVNIDPEPNELSQVLAAQNPTLNYQSIWTFEPSRLAFGPASSPAGQWLFYEKNTPAAVNTLHTLYGHRGYLIKMNGSGQLRLTGQPLARNISFTSRTANLFGAITNSQLGPLTFAEFFSHPKAAGKIRSSGQPVKYDIFAMTAGGFVRKTISDVIAPNAAYWINVIQDIEYSGPLDITARANGISFGRNSAIRTLAVEVPSSPTSRTVSVQARPCIGLGGSACPPGGSNVDWLEYRELTAALPPLWHPLSQGVNVVVPAGVSLVELELRARRDMATVVAAARGVGTGEFSGVIEVSDSLGSQVAIAAEVEIEPIYGRWIGYVELNRVSTHPTIQQLPLEESPAPPLTMALLLDLPDPNAVVAGATPRLLDAVTIQTFRDGKPLQRRFNSILFDRPVNLLEEAGNPLDPFGGTGTLRGVLHILPDDSLNPYRHRYNPEHRKGYDITRQITIQLENQPPSLADELAGLDGTFGPLRLTGHYTEIITGVTHDAITVKGSFRLERLGGESIASPR